MWKDFKYVFSAGWGHSSSCGSWRTVMIAGLTMLETALGHSLCIGLFKVLGSNVNTSFLLPESLTNCTQVKGDFAQINHCLVSGSLYVFILGKSCWLQLHLFHGSIKVMLFENHTFFPPFFQLCGYLWPSCPPSCWTVRSEMCLWERGTTLAGPFGALALLQKLLLTSRNGFSSVTQIML